MKVITYPTGDTSIINWCHWNGRFAFADRFVEWINKFTELQINRNTIMAQEKIVDLWDRYHDDVIAAALREDN